MTTFRTKAAIVCLIACTNASITADGLWDNKDWYNNSADIGVKKGVPYSKDSEATRRISSGMAAKGSVSSTYKKGAGVKRVMSVLPEVDYEFLFEERNDIYTYKGLLQAIAKFPAFCNESNWDDLTDDETCKKELATLFAHFNKETGQNDPH